MLASAPSCRRLAVGAGKLTFQSACASGPQCGSSPRDLAHFTFDLLATPAFRIKYHPNKRLRLACKVLSISTWHACHGGFRSLVSLARCSLLDEVTAADSQYGRCLAFTSNGFSKETVLGVAVACFRCWIRVTKRQTKVLVAACYSWATCVRPQSGMRSCP